jgi:hyperosmotically inducible protein
MKLLLLTGQFLLAVTLTGGAALAQDAKTPMQDRKGLPTADSQKGNSTDREITRHIRRALVADKSLSSAAHNVKIISRDGKVTLRGRVNSDEEKQQIEQRATEIVGAGNVTSMLDVKSGSSTADRAKKKDAHDVSNGGENTHQ